jgi:hypothetical protein
MTKLILLLAVSTQLFANEGSNFFEKFTNRHLDYKTSFKINKDLGRAWVVITEINDFFEETEETEIPVNIEGLKFNKETSEITYKSSVCATYTQYRRYYTLSNTGNCLINKTYSTVEVDDGFYIKKKLKVEFSFSI